MLAPEVHPAPKSTKHQGRAQVVIGGSASETQVLFFTEAEARQWATTGKTATDGGRGAGPAHGRSAALPPPPGPVQPQQPPAPAGSPADTRSTTTAPVAPDPAPAADRDVSADARRLPAPAADPGDGTASAPATPSANPLTPADDDQAVGLREAHQHHLPDITVAALRYARANDSTFPKPVGKRGAELLYRVGDLKKWARNRPRAATGGTGLD
ncbi:hypothetical protein ABT391_35060 [Streptomyces jumonjinensis]|uniref:hypothetical protein n=1 Tax=Streptomyces jumonjinensis TaxID=1945 RepID=UPI0033217DF4